jgi:hypothetical protein
MPDYFNVREEELGHDLEESIDEFLFEAGSECCFTFDNRQFHHLLVFTVKVLQRNFHSWGLNFQILTPSGVVRKRSVLCSVCRECTHKISTGGSAVLMAVSCWCANGTPVYVCEEGAIDFVLVPPKTGWVAADGLDRPKNDDRAFDRMGTIISIGAHQSVRLNRPATI